jgi:phage tail-like protein
MDANGTRFHLLLGKSDWGSCDEEIGKASGEPLRIGPLSEAWAASPPEESSLWNEQRSELTLRPRLYRYVAAPNDNPPVLDDRRGAGRDSFGNWYWIDKSRLEIRVNSAGTRVTSHFWSIGDGVACEPPSRFGDFSPMQRKEPLVPVELSGLAVTTDHYLVVGTLQLGGLQPGGLLIFDLYASGPPIQKLWPVKFVPFDMSPRPSGGVCILDRDRDLKSYCYWVLDRHFNVVLPDQEQDVLTSEVVDTFQPTDGGLTRRTVARNFPEGISLQAASPPDLVDPISIETLPDDTVLILDYDPSRRFALIHHYCFGRPLGEPLSTKSVLPLVEEEDKPDFTLIGFDLAFVPANGIPKGEVAGLLYVVDHGGNQAYAFSLLLGGDQLCLEAREQYLPMRLFGGKGLVATPDGPYYDFGERWIPLVAQRRPRYKTDAKIVTRCLDGREPDCVWHRMMLDACIPPETHVSVESRAANNVDDLENTQWQPEPPLHKRSDGSELPFIQKSDCEDCGTWELLFQHARGRYVELKLILSSDNGCSSPRLRALRAYYPRFSYLDHYLPSVYREERESASFLDRFLANMEGFCTALEDKIAAVQMLFDVRSVPAETLDWLACWFGVVLDPAWDERKRRLFIKYAMSFFQYRGTIRGLSMTLRLALEDCPDETIFTDSGDRHRWQGSIRIVEKYRTRRTPGVVLGDATELVEPRLISPAARWLPNDGRDELNWRYSKALNLQVIEYSVGHNVTLAYDVSADADKVRVTIHSESGNDVKEQEIGKKKGRNFFTWDGTDKLQKPVATGNYSFSVDASDGSGNSVAVTSFLFEKFPVRIPGDTRRAAWQQFSRDALGFVPSASSEHQDLWQDFLARRHRNIAALNNTYRLSGSRKLSSISDAQLPEEPRGDGAPLQDWYQFEGVVLAMHKTAHHFSVLLAAPPTKRADGAEHMRRLQLAQRLVDLEKPAHTHYDVKFYWALFRIGASRLGEDTLLDVGSRAPQLLQPMVLGQNYLAESYLAPGYPQNIEGRQVLGSFQLNHTASS